MSTDTDPCRFGRTAQEPVSIRSNLEYGGSSRVQDAARRIRPSNNAELLTANFRSSSLIQSQWRNLTFQKEEPPTHAHEPEFFLRLLRLLAAKASPFRAGWLFRLGTRARTAVQADQSATGRRNDRSLHAPRPDASRAFLVHSCNGPRPKCGTALSHS